MQYRLAMLRGVLCIVVLPFATETRADTISYADAVSTLSKDCLASSSV